MKTLAETVDQLDNDTVQYWKRKCSDAETLRVCLEGEIASRKYKEERKKQRVQDEIVGMLERLDASALPVMKRLANGADPERIKNRLDREAVTLERELNELRRKLRPLLQRRKQLIAKRFSNLALWSAIDKGMVSKISEMIKKLQ